MEPTRAELQLGSNQRDTDGRFGACGSHVFFSMPLTPPYSHWPPSTFLQVTDASGFMGSHIVEHLLKAGYRVRG